MFEAVIIICEVATGDVCRTGLLPGYEAKSMDECRANLEEKPPVLSFEKFARAKPFCISSKGALEMAEIAEGVFVHQGKVETPTPENRGDTSNLGFVIGQNSVAVIDSGGSRLVGEELWRSIRAETDLPVSHVILTHMHPDHVFGATLFEEAGAEIIGHHRLERAILDRADSYIASQKRQIGVEAFLCSTLPEQITPVETETIIDLGGRVLTLTAWPDAHSVSDLTVHDPTAKVLFSGDLVFDSHIPTLDGSVTGWQRILDEIKTIEATKIMPGHGPMLFHPEGINATARYLDELEQGTRAAIQAGARIGEAADLVAADERNNWQLFDEYHTRNVTVAFTELEWE